MLETPSAVRADLGGVDEPGKGLCRRAVEGACRALFSVERPESHISLSSLSSVPWVSAWDEEDEDEDEEEDGRGVPFPCAWICTCTEP